MISTKQTILKSASADFFSIIGEKMRTIDDYHTVMTKRLILRSVELADAPAMYQWLGDKETVKWLSGEILASIADVEEQAIRGYFWHDIAHTKKYGIALRDTNQLIGGVDFRQNLDNNDAEIGYVLTSAMRGYGYMAEAVTELLHIGFDIINLDSIWISHDLKNAPSRRIPERLNFVNSGQDKQGHVVWTMSRDNYNKQKDE